MSRKRRIPTCQCGQPARRGEGAKLCAKCYAALGRPKAQCRVCEIEIAADRLVGKRCRPCISAANHGKRIVATYGLTPEMYDQLLDRQEGRCYICQRRPVSKRLAVDHRHSDGAVRGLLCRNCNRNVLGHLRDSVDALQRAVDYLQNPPARLLFGRDVTPLQDGGVK